VTKPNRRKTVRDTDRLKALQETVDVLVAEGRLLRAQMDELRTRDELRELRKLLRRQNARSPYRLRDDPDDDSRPTEK
jgi:hypothetical protein